MNSCNSNSYNSKSHVIRTDSVVPSEFTLKTLQENSYNSNPCNSKNHVNRTDFPVPWRNFHHVIRIFEFFKLLKLTNSTFCQSNIFNKTFLTFKLLFGNRMFLFLPSIRARLLLCLPFLIKTSKMGKTKPKAVTLKTKYEALRDWEDSISLF